MLIGITLIPRFIHRCMIILCRIISIPWFYLFYRARSLPFDEGYILSTKRKGFELLLFLKRKEFRINRGMKLKKICCSIISIPWFYLFYRARSLPFDEGYILSTKRKGFELLLFLKRKEFRINRGMKLKKICCSIRNRVELSSHYAFTRLKTIQEYHHLDLVQVFRIFLSQNNF